MRAFIAVPLAPSLVEYLIRLQEGLKRAGADITWVKPEQMHCTLAFFAEIDEPSLRRVESHCGVLLQAFHTFTLTPGHIGAFPSHSLPKVIYCGVKEGKEQLISLAGTVRKACLRAGVMLGNDKPFSPHITLGRARSDTHRRQICSCLAQSPPAPDTLSSAVLKILFFSSTLTRTGPVYQELAATNLATA
jgi:RNA 2',3'-cyclic 3'-phosphodiesterase